MAAKHRPCSFGQWLRKLPYGPDRRDGFRGRTSSTKKEGVNTIFPQQFIVETHDEAVESILQTQSADVDMLKDFVSSNYGLEVVCREIEEVLNDQNPNKTAGEIHESIT